MKIQIQKLLLALALGSAALPLPAQDTAFTFQGRLTENGAPGDGINDLTFTLYTAASGGATVGASNVVNDLAVSNGLFTVTLDFGASAFDGNARWLQIAARPGASTGAYTLLSPRQAVNATPYAVRAANFSGAVTDNQLSANIAKLDAPAAFTAAVSFSNAMGTFSGNGAGLSNINLAANSAGAISAMGGFAPPFLLEVGASPVSIATADVNGDGRMDLISANGGSHTLTVLTNSGSGGFGVASSPAVGDTPFSVAAGDVNGDGKVDLISANYGTNTLSVLTNTGTGGFVLASSLLVDSASAAVTAADVNADGRVDLISASTSSNRLSLLTNNGTGSFALASTSDVGAGPSWVSAVDVNADGKVDLISANFGTNTLSVLTNIGNGRFALASSPFVSPDVSSTPFSVAAAHLNGDGSVDLISANVGNDTLSVLTNSGGGTFVLASSLAVDRLPYSVAAADVNGDGTVDLISANSSADTLSLLINNGHGGFVLASSPLVGSTPIGVIAMDVNADGKVDLINANAGDGTLSVLLNTLAFNGGFSGTFNGSFVGSGAGLTRLGASNLIGSVPSASLTSIPADYLTGSVPPTTLVSIPAANLYGLVPATSLGIVPAENLVGSVPATSLTFLPAGNLVGQVPSASLTSVPAGSLTGFVPPATLNLVPAANLYGIVPATSLVTVPAENLVGSVPSGSLSSVPAANLFGSVPSGTLNSVPAGSLTGTILDARLSANVAHLNGNETVTGFYSFNPLAGNPPFAVNSTVQVNNLNAQRLGGLTASQFWQSAGNAGTTPGTHFLGTADNQPLEVKVNGLRALRLEPNAGGAPNVIGGSHNNFVTPGVGAATIAGGGQNSASNRVTAYGGTISGGVNNSVINSSGTVGGGNDNTAAGFVSTVGGGFGNVSSALYGTVGGGRNNTNISQNATVGGGVNNAATEINATVSGGGNNKSTGQNATVSGGSDNLASGNGATVPGGQLNTASGNYSFAAGYSAKANHYGSFVWSDFSGPSLISTAPNQFLIRAAGGVGIGTTAPAQLFHLNVGIGQGEGMRIDSAIGGHSPAIYLNHTGAGGRNFRLASYGDNSNPGSFRIRHAMAGAERFTIEADGSTRVLGSDHWDVNNTEGDFRVGTDAYRLKIGVSLGGSGAGDVWVRTHGGTARLFIKTPGGTTIFSNEGQTTGVALAGGGGSWSVVSDRNAKENFTAVNAREILQRVASLPLTTWNYKSQEKTIRHIGPMAQDFAAAFHVGEDNKHITTVDADGVALAAIQGLNQKLEEKDAELQALKQTVAELKAAFDQLGRAPLPHAVTR